MRRSACRIVAIFALLSALSVPPATAEAPAEAWVRNLRSDDTRYNGYATYVRILNLLEEGGPDALPSSLTPRLENALASDDYQLRQYAAMILFKVFDHQQKSVSEWPEDLLENMVLGLRDDSDKNLNPNALILMTALYGRKDPEVTARLEREVVEGDLQSKFCAAMALVRQGTEAVRPEVTAALALNLRDDEVPLNELAAYHGIHRLGGENLRRYLEQATVVDWQEAALLQCLAADLGVPWAAPESIAEQWRTRATWANREGVYAVAALYLYPERDEFLKGKETPAALKRILGVDGGAKTRTEKARQARGRISFMRGEENLCEWECGLPGLVTNILRVWPGQAPATPAAGESRGTEEG